VGVVEKKVPEQGDRRKGSGLEEGLELLKKGKLEQRDNKASQFRLV